MSSDASKTDLSGVKMAVLPDFAKVATAVFAAFSGVGLDSIGLLSTGYSGWNTLWSYWLIADICL